MVTETNKDDLGLPKIDAAEAFDRLRTREEKQRALEEYKWTLKQVLELQERALNGDDAEAVRTWEAYKPYVENSNRRQNFLYPHQMSRSQATEHLASTGLDNEPAWSLLEARWIASDPALFEKYGTELRRIQEIGSLIPGPGMEKGQVYGFGETPEEAEKQFRFKLECLDKRMAAEKALGEAVSGLEAAKKLGDGTAKAFLHEKLTEVLKNHNSLYDVEKLQQYGEVKRAFYETGGKDVDLTVRFWRRPL